MAYAFDSANGDQRSMLAERVVFNSFSATRYAEFVKRALNDAVTDICRQLSIGESYEVLSYNANGLVGDPTLPWFKVDEVWSANATVAASGEVAFSTAVNAPLQRMMDHELGSLPVRGSLLFYIVRRRKAPSGFAPTLDIIVASPPAAGGFVAVKGEQRPAVMAADTDRTGLGADLDNAVVAFAKAMCFDNEDDFQAAQYWRGRFTDELRTVVEGDVTDDGPNVVDGTWDS